MKELKILYLENDPQDAWLAARVLKNAGIPFRFCLVDRQYEYEVALQQFSPDLILADHSIAQFDSLEALRIKKRCHGDMPFILVTGSVSETYTELMLKEGAQDYLLKENLAQLPGIILQAVDKSLWKEPVSCDGINTDLSKEQIRKHDRLDAPSLKNKGLYNALQELFTGQRQTGQLEVNLNYQNLLESVLPAYLEITLFRIIQEQLTNIGKYAHAGKVRLTLLVSDKSLYLAITDNGVGFVPTQRTKGLGFRNMYRSVQLFSGIMEIHSAPGKGCTLEIKIPL